MASDRDGRWRRSARSIIGAAILDSKRRGGLPTTGDEFFAFKRQVGKLYPWGERKHHPYKMWSMEMAIAFDRLYVEIFAKTGVHSAYRVRCPACGAGAGVPCRSMGAIQDDLMIAKDAELDGRDDDAKTIRDNAWHDARLMKVGLGSAANETLPLFQVTP